MRLEQLIGDAHMALETLGYCGERQDARSHAMSSAEWLEQIAVRIRAELAALPKEEVPS